MIIDTRTHTYYHHNGGVLPGVTSILKSVGLMQNEQYYTPAGAMRGTSIHMLCQRDCEAEQEGVSRLAADSSAAESYGQYLQYLDAWKLYKRESGWTSIMIENPLSGSVGGNSYAGTPDRIGRFDGEADTPLTILDIKTGGGVSQWTRYQLAAYVHLAGESRIDGEADTPIIGRCAIQLSPQGYKIVHYPVASLRSDIEVFAAALSVYVAKNAQEGGGHG